MHGPDLTTQRFGKLTVIRLLSTRRRGMRDWECLCDCGKTTHVTTTALLSKNTKSCGCWRSRPREVKHFLPHIKRSRLRLKGQRFGRLTAIERSAGRAGNAIKWKCLCDCGNIAYVAGHRLKSGHTQSCGCYQAEKRYGPRKSFKTKFAAGHGARNALIKGYKQQAKTRNLRWELTDEEFIDLTQRDCFYCGMSPHRIRAISKNGSIVYNGVDRRNNDLGYTTINAVPCCFTCNKAKGTTSEVEFREWIRRVYEHLESHRGHIKTSVDSRPCNGTISGVELLLG